MQFNPSDHLEAGSFFQFSSEPVVLRVQGVPGSMENVSEFETRLVALESALKVLMASG